VRPQLTIVMPCLNEAETVATCIEKAAAGLRQCAVTGEIVVADNGSTDGSTDIAREHGARVVHVAEKGYGNALRAGIDAAEGQWVLMGDADDSYDFSDIGKFVDRLRDGYELVMGCRLPNGGGRIARGAMPWKNRWIGNPALSLIGRLFFRTPIHDFHCGMRAFTKAAYQQMDLKTTGMEFASEMVMKATLKSMQVAEVPITLYPDGRSRPPHLKAWRDGWRHLRFMLIYSPRWLFLAPGVALCVLGLFLSALLAASPVRIGGVSLDVGTLAITSMLIVIGIQLVAFAFFTKVFAIGEGLLPDDPRFSRLFRYMTLERGLTVGILIGLAGVILLIRAFTIWGEAGYGALSYAENLSRLIPAVTCIVVAMQVVFSSFFLSVLGLRTGSRTPPS